jgi:hypothetical protein
MPPAHDTVAMHVSLQAPQCCGEVRKSTQVPPQSVSPTAQLHVPLVHARGKAQADPHAPQFVALAVVSTQAPPAQSMVPSGQTHEPPTHEAPVGHDVPHVPQLAVSTAVSVQLPEHSTRPPAQRHTPAEHV